MAYASKQGRRPAEYASKSAHSHVIKDPVVQAFLGTCNLSNPGEEDALPLEQRCIDYLPVTNNPIQYVIAIDGGYTEVPVREKFPSATVSFFQLGILTFTVDDLDRLTKQSFIDPDDIAKLKQIQRLKFTLPVRNVIMKAQQTLSQSVRAALFEFFQQRVDDGNLIDSLRWLVFQEYANPLDVWQLSTCPVCGHSKIPLNRLQMSKDHKFACSNCGETIYLTDVFRLHEFIDDEIGAGQILAYVCTTIEQILFVHLIRLILRLKPALLGQILFIKDGPLAFFGPTSNMQQPMRALIRFLFEHHNLYLAGLEKSGAFVEHADQITDKMKSGSVLILDNDYIYRHILPEKTDASSPYGRTSYYSNKVFFKTRSGSMYVVSLPMGEIKAFPTADDLQNLQLVLTNIEKLRCDMYDSALIPVALANKLVSLANHPSSKILQRFATQTIGH